MSWRFIRTPTMDQRRLDFSINSKNQPYPPLRRSPSRLSAATYPERGASVPSRSPSSLDRSRDTSWSQYSALSRENGQTAVPKQTGRSFCAFPSILLVLILSNALRTHVTLPRGESASTSWGICGPPAAHHQCGPRCCQATYTVHAFFKQTSRQHHTMYRKEFDDFTPPTAKSQTAEL